MGSSLVASPPISIVSDYNHPQHYSKREVNNYTEQQSERVQIPALHQLRRSLDLSKLRATGVLSTSGGGSSQPSVSNRQDPMRRSLDNKFLQIQIQCSSALDNSGFREVQTAIQNLRTSMASTTQQSPMNGNAFS